MIRTGSIGLDIALRGGWRPGCMYEIWGDTGSGKTVLALHSVESAVRARQDVLWLDLNDGVRHMDHAPRVIVGRPRSAEEAFTIADAACHEESIGLIVIDPAQCLVRQRELDGDPDFVPHPQREYKTELADLKTAARLTNTVVLFVSQPRDKERQPVRGTGISEKVLGRVHLHPDVVHQDGSREIDVHITSARATQYNVARFTVRPGTGIDRELELVEVAIDHGVMARHGSWVKYHGMFASYEVQGTTAMARLLSRKPEVMHYVDQEVREVTAI